MRARNLMQWLLIAALAAFLAAGCAKKPAPEVTAPPTAGEAPVTTETPGDQDVRGIQERPITEAPAQDRAAQDRLSPQADATSAGLQRIYFDFDQYTLTPEARETLNRNAAYLKANPRVKVRIEGHTDERGSDEYNIALGERRARSAREYLISLGIDANRLTTISYGEEMPLEQGSDEAAWSKNRRAEFNAVSP